MRTVLPLALLALSACNPTASGPVGDVGLAEATDNVDRTEGDIVEGRFLVKIDGDVSAIRASLDAIGASELVPVPGAPNTYSFNSDAAPPVVGQLAEFDATVGWIEPVVRYYPLADAPDDPHFTYQWHHTVLGTLDAWDGSLGDGVIVAVVDTGVHDATVVEDAPINLLPGISYVDSEIVNDDVGHGTHIANTIAQAANNGINGAGIAPNVSILPIRVLGKNGGTSEDVATGIRYAVDNGADIINLSLGGPIYSDVLAEACQYAKDNGVLVFAAGGNDGYDHFVSFPAALDSTIAVGAIGPDGLVTDYSNRGPQLAFTAPGGVYYDYDRNGFFDGILADTVVEYLGVPGYEDGFYTGSFFQVGTSQATAAATASAALLMGAGADADTVLALLQETAVDEGAEGWDPAYGHGAIDVGAAMQALLADPDPDPDPVCLADACGEDVAGLNVTIDEVMPDPVTCLDAHGEWIEVVNNDVVSVSLDGLQLIDLAFNAGTIHMDGILQPGERAVLGKGDPSAFCGPDIDGWFDGPGINNSNELLCIYTEAGFDVDTSPSWAATESGVSLQRDGDTWVASTTPFGDAEFATPGFAPDESEPPLEFIALIPGDIVVSEFMANPSWCASDSCEWIEIENKTFYTIALDGMELGDASTSVILNTSLTIEPTKKLVLAKGTAENWSHPDVSPDLFYGNLTLNNSADSVYITNGLWTIFSFDYTSSLAQSGVSAELVDSTFGTAGMWTLSTHELTSGELATPGF